MKLFVTFLAMMAASTATAFQVQPHNVAALSARNHQSFLQAAPVPSEDDLAKTREVIRANLDKNEDSKEETQASQNEVAVADE
jgi:hypothetical protein